MKKIAVVLSGCGVFDGAEIHESVLTLLYLDQAGVEVKCFAPDIKQAHVINHTTGEEMQEERNVLIEAARISRGNIQALSALNVDDFDAIILPGGFGAAKNLCSFAFDGANCTVNPEIESTLKAFHETSKPIGIMCIAPVIGAKVLGAEVTIGNDAGVAEAIKNFGGSHVDKPVTDINIDETNNVISAPAYMYDAGITQVAIGIEKVVKEVLSRA